MVLRNFVMAGWIVLLTACSGQDAGLGDSAESGSGEAGAPAESGPFVRETGGKLSALQAAFDVKHYDLSIQVFPERREIKGKLTVDFQAIEELSTLALDLDPNFQVKSVHAAGSEPESEPESELEFEHRRGKLLIQFPEPVAAGTSAKAIIQYSGLPRVAPNPPWEGGFQWEHTQDGEPWIATSCQMEGADLWWPCKDHPSDKADGIDLHIRVPEPLVCASNGLLQSVEDHGDGTRTYHWKESYPIANYCVALNIAPYELIEEEFQSVSGDSMPVKFWLLPEHVESGKKILPQFLDHLRYFEKILGPYPFRGEKYGIADTPHMGMEHQTIIAYGNNFQPFKWGFDWLHHHELAHEWFANLVTAPNWNDFWIHEGFGNYLQKLYVEEVKGRDAYRGYLADVRPYILNARPVAPRGPRSSAQMYFVDMNQPEGQRGADSDIYYKGEWILHSLRWVIGKEALLRTFAKMCYPTEADRQSTDGSACHFFTTDDYLALAEQESGMELDWFFELYLRQPHLPELQVSHDGNTLLLKWKVPAGLSCEIPVEVVIGGVPKKVAMPNGHAELRVAAGMAVDIDPFNRILRAGNSSAP